MKLSGIAVFLALLQWPSRSGIAMAQQTEDCNTYKIQQVPFIHKSSYNIGIDAIYGLDEAFDESSKIFGDYLTATAGKRFDPPIQFNVVPGDYGDLIASIENKELDFLYANPGIYTCIGAQTGANALVTAVKTLLVRGQSFDLDVYGGVIAVRNDNDAINTIADLKDKIIGAADVVHLVAGQMQAYEMEKAGLSFIHDPKQVVFTKNQAEIVRGVLNGTFDVGFVQTNQIEGTLGESGELVDPALFKIIDSKIYVMESGEMFPFLHSTAVFPEWPFSALTGVPPDVQHAVQTALLNYGKYYLFSQLLNCSNAQGPTQDDIAHCEELRLKLTELGPLCNNTDNLVLLATQGTAASSISSFRTAPSYFEVRSTMEEARFLMLKDEQWHCMNPDKVYDDITCPSGYFKRTEHEYLTGCAEAGLECHGKDCFCKPCIKAFDVDVYHLKEGEADPHLDENTVESLPGCEKMSVCAEVYQRQSIIMRIFDNMRRENANVSVIVHARNNQSNLQVTKIPGTYGYEFVVIDNQSRTQVIDIRINGEAISQSPIRVMVLETDCDAIYGESSYRVPDVEGNCVCAGNTYEMADTCLKSSAYFMIIFSALFVTIGTVLFFFLGYRKKQSDSIWHVNPDELQINEPPEIIGAGGFGVVILAQYRGTKVAVKRVLPPSRIAKNKNSMDRDISGTLGSSQGVREVQKGDGSTAIEKTTNKSSETSKAIGGRVKFGKVSTMPNDIESQHIESKSTSAQIKTNISGSNSNKEWERMMMHHSSNDILKLLESATTSDHGSMNLFDSASQSVTLLKFVPMCLRFDAHARRVNEFVNEMRMLSRLRHPCITTVMGAVVTSSVDPMLVMEFMEYGSLHDLLNNETMSLGGEIILQVMRDIVQGIQFLHASKPPILHGDLKAKNILVDSRFRAKVADFGFSHFKSNKQRNILQGTPFYMAPEYLRRRSEYTTACDIYSLAMIVYEVYARAAPFDGEDPRKVLPKVCHPRLNKRPTIPESCPPKMVELMKKCWSANPFFRPTAKDIDYLLVEMKMTDTEPLKTAMDRAQEGLKRQRTSLYDVFPKHIADALQAGKKVEAESHEVVTVVFSDIVGFTTISEQFGPLKVSNMLDRLYQAFDALADKHRIFKVETIGDSYMGVTNLSGNEFETHVKQAAEYAQDAIQAASQMLIDEDDPSKGYIQIRVGFHSGPVVSNVIGSLNPRYGLFGDTVNTASRMESNSMPGKIHCTFTAAQLLQSQAPEIPLTFRGIIHIKGKGKMKTFWVGSDNDQISGMTTPPQSLDRPITFSEDNDHVAISLTESSTLKQFSDHDTKASSSASTSSASHNGSLCISHRTHDTVISQASVDSEQDHFIRIHTQHESRNKIIL